MELQRATARGAQVRELKELQELWKLLAVMFAIQDLQLCRFESQF